MFRILALASMVVVPFTISHATADDANTCPNSTELVNKSGVTNVELAQAIQCLGKGLENKATAQKSNDAAAIIELASKIIGNGSPLAHAGTGALAMAATKSVADVPVDKTPPADPNRVWAGNIICQANTQMNRNPAEDPHLPTGFTCAEVKEPAIIELASKIIGNG
jgi:hypothetical protein